MDRADPAAIAASRMLPDLKIDAEGARGIADLAFDQNASLDLAGFKNLQFVGRGKLFYGGDVLAVGLAGARHLGALRRMHPLVGTMTNFLERGDVDVSGAGSHIDGQLDRLLGVCRTDDAGIRQRLPFAPADPPQIVLRISLGWGRELQAWFAGHGASLRSCD